jgi:hypothetical protein
MWWLWIFPLVGAGLLVGGVMMAVNTLNFLHRGQTGLAQVVGYSTSVDDGTTMYSPTLRLIDPPLGLERGTGVSSSDRKWRVGTKLRVKIAPDDPGNYQIDSPDDALMGPLICGVIGAVFLIMGLVFVFIFNGPRDEVVWEPDHDLTLEQMELKPADSSW